MDIRQMNILSLAYLGDAVYELEIRKHFVDLGIQKVNNLQKEALNYVSAKMQSKYIEYLLDNNMLYEDEIEPALKEALFLHTIGVDALIVQDLGFTYECLKRYPDLELHASTQMHVHNLEGAVNIV